MLGKDSGIRKKIFALFLVLIVAATPMFAADDDFGFNAYTQKVVNWFYGITAGLLVLSLIIWGGVCALKHGVTPKDWVSLAAILLGGVVILLAPTIVSGIFGGGQMGDFSF